MSIEFAGDHMTLTEADDGSASMTFGPKPPGARVCGSCSLCCKLLPIPPLNKPAGKRCDYQRHGKGCTIYADRPDSCRAWPCRWLVDKSTAGLPRPDRAHYVIDIKPDFITLREDGGEPRKVPVLQVWVDEAFPDAHRAPELRAWIVKQAERFPGAALVRTAGNTRALVLFPPSMAADGQWHERETIFHETPHTMEEIAAALRSSTPE